MIFPSNPAADAAPIAPIPRDEEEIAAAAARLGLSIPPTCLPGVVQNLALLERHAATVLGQAALAR